MDYSFVLPSAIFVSCPSLPFQRPCFFAQPSGLFLGLDPERLRLFSIESFWAICCWPLLLILMVAYLGGSIDPGPNYSGS